MMSNAKVSKQSSPVNKRRSIEELKMKYESSNVFETSKMSTKPKSPKMLKKSKVKQIALMFNSKISQIIKRDAEVGKYAELVNEFSPEPKPQPLSRSRFTKPKAPVPCPRMRILVNIQEKPSSCFVAEDVFAKLSVKDKAQLYTQFVEEMYKKNPKFVLLEESNKRLEIKREVIEEKQPTVKDLLEELEFNTVFSKPTTTGAKALQRMDSMKRACAARKKLQTQKSKEFEDNFVKKAQSPQKQIKSLPRFQNASTEKSLSDNEIHVTTNSVFQNQQLENLFFSWLKEKQDNDNKGEEMANNTEIDEDKQKSAIDRLLEEAIAKLESIEAKQNSDVPKPMPRKKATFENKSTTSSVKPSEAEESESGLSSLPKITSEESQPESHQSKTETSEKDYEFSKPLKPLRKKKLRRNAVLKKEENNQLTSTDSESDIKKAETMQKNKKIVQSNQEETANQPESSFLELNQSLMKEINSPRKIKSAYTLTVNDLETPLCTPRASMNFAKHSPLNKSKNKNAPARFLTDSLTDQGFETATNDADSPLKRCEVTQSPASSSLNFSKGSFGFSTPIKNQEHHSFGNTSSAKQLFSPIAKPMKSRRRSIYEVESRRNSLAMQVIREDQPLEPHEINSSKLYSQSEQKFFANAPTIEMTNELPKEKTSQFWIKCGDFEVNLEINNNDKERVRLLYEIFSQTSCDTKDLHFGIDDHKFSVHGPMDMDNISTRVPASKGCSHYWFSTGNLTIPFSGRYLASHKIQRLFRVIKETVEETGILCFGVDEVEFSNVPEFWHQPAKFSVESQYSMLVGLQSGDSNGLEGRSKYAWPHSKPVMISDLDHSDNEANNFKEIESGRLSFSPFGSNHYDLASLDNEELSMPRNSLAMMSLESFCGEYESEPLDQLFDDRKQEWKQTQNMSLPEMVNTVQNEQQRLSAVHEHLSNNVKPSYISKDSLDALKGTPEYVAQLKSIVSDISNIGCSNNFKECSVDELESYMHFLSRYAEICLGSCRKHMTTVLDALVDYKAVVV